MSVVNCKEILSHVRVAFSVPMTPIVIKTCLLVLIKFQTVTVFIQL